MPSSGGWQPRGTRSVYAHNVCIRCLCVWVYIHIFEQFEGIKTILDVFYQQCEALGSSLSWPGPDGRGLPFQPLQANSPHAAQGAGLCSSPPCFLFPSPGALDFSRAPFSPALGSSTWLHELVSFCFLTNTFHPSSPAPLSPGPLAALLACQNPFVLRWSQPIMTHVN